jgi:polyribonucleotide nucleotidyltransferase
MPNPKSQAAIIGDIWGLLEAAERSPDIRASIETELQALSQSYTKIRTLKARQEELSALRQEVTQQLQAALAEGKENAVIFRSLVRSKLGPRNERLVHYKVAPLRKRPRKRQVVEKVLPGEATGVAAE